MVQPSTEHGAPGIDSNLRGVSETRRKFSVSRPFFSTWYVRSPLFPSSRPPPANVILLTPTREQHRVITFSNSNNGGQGPALNAGSGQELPERRVGSAAVPVDFSSAPGRSFQIWGRVSVCRATNGRSRLESG